MSGTARRLRPAAARLLGNAGIVLGLALLGEIALYAVGDVTSRGSATFPNPDMSLGGPAVWFLVLVWTIASALLVCAWFIPAGSRRDWALLLVAAAAAGAYGSTSGPVGGASAIAGALAWAISIPRASWRFASAMALQLAFEGPSYALRWGQAAFWWTVAASGVVLAAGYGARYWSVRRHRQLPLVP